MHQRQGKNCQVAITFLWVILNYLGWEEVKQQ